MKLQILSDLHLDFAPYTIQLHPEADMLVLAGDMCEPHMLGRLRKMLQPIDIPILMVMGNHDHYNHELAAVQQVWRDFAASFPVGLITVLGLDRQEPWIEFDKLVLVGGTLWSNFDLYGTQQDSARAAQRNIADFDLIRVGTSRIIPADMIAMHKQCRQDIRGALELGKQTVVITHFCPFPQSVHPQYTGDAINPYFASDCSDLLQDNLALWIHGHTHCPFDYRLGATRVVCNPRGYPRENTGYNHLLLVEI